MPVTIEIPDERAGQVGLVLRHAANEFHGALAREPNADCADAWRATAAWFEAKADEVLAVQTGLLRFKQFDSKHR